MLRFHCSPDVSLQDLSSGCISEPQRGPTVGRKIIRARRSAAISVLSRRLPPGSRLRLYFRAPERGNSRSLNHLSATVCCDLGAPGTNIQTISVLALALESVGEDSSSTLSWPHEAKIEAMRASAKNFCRRSQAPTQELRLFEFSFREH